MVDAEAAQLRGEFGVGGLPAGSERLPGGGAGKVEQALGAALAVAQLQQAVLRWASLGRVAQQQGDKVMAAGGAARA